MGARFYLGKWLIGLIYLFTGSLFLVGIVYDFWTLNEQVSEINYLNSSGQNI